MGPTSGWPAYLCASVSLGPRHWSESQRCKGSCPCQGVSWVLFSSGVIPQSEDSFMMRNLGVL